jgi:predicted peroxiredoxin
MTDKLGIFVSSDKHKAMILGLGKAAMANGKEVHVFFTGPGVNLSPDPDVQELMKAGAKMTLCDKTYQSLGLNEDYGEILEGFEHGSQDNNAAMINEMDRYVVL